MCNQGRRGFHQLVAVASLSNRWTACRKLKYGVKCWTPWLKEVGHTNLCGQLRWFLLGLLPLQILDFLIIMKGSFILAAETRIYCFDQTGVCFCVCFHRGSEDFLWQGRAGLRCPELLPGDVHQRQRSVTRSCERVTSQLSAGVKATDSSSHSSSLLHSPFRKRACRQH